MGLNHADEHGEGKDDESDLHSHDHSGDSAKHRAHEKSAKHRAFEAWVDKTQLEIFSDCIVMMGGY